MAKQEKRLSLTFKFVLLTAAIVAAASLFTGYMLISNEKAIVESGMRARGRTIANNIASNSEYGVLVKNKKGLNEVLNKAKAEEDLVYAMILDRRGNVLARFSEDPESPISQELDEELMRKALSADEPLVQFYETGEPEKPFYDIAVPIMTVRADRGREEIGFAGIGGVRERIGTVRVGISLEKVNEIISGETVLSFLVTFIAVGLSVLFSGLLSIVILRPVRSLISGSRRVAEGDLEHRIEVRSDDEIGLLSDAFNQMIDEFKKCKLELEGSGKNLEFKVEERAREIKESKAYLENILRNMADGLLVLDTEGNISDVNAALEKISGQKREGLVKKRAVQALFPADRARAIEVIEQTKKQGLITGYELNMSLKDAEKPVAVHFSGATLKDSEGKVQGIVAIIHDMRREKEVEMMKSEFTSIVSHELNTPLTSIQGFVYLMLSGKLGEINADQRKHLDTVYRQSLHLKSLIGSLLDFSMIEMGRLEIEENKIDMSAVVKRSVESLDEEAKKRGSNVELDIAKKIPQVIGDEGKVERAFTHVISNALRFTPKGGEIKVSVKQSGKNVEISVKDNGVGIAKENLDKVFERFYQVDSSLTRRIGGIGVGLALTKAIIEAHGGSIKAESEGLDKGSKFTITLPAA